MRSPLILVALLALCCTAAFAQSVPSTTATTAAFKESLTTEVQQGLVALLLAIINAVFLGLGWLIKLGISRAGIAKAEAAETYLDGLLVRAAHETGEWAKHRSIVEKLAVSSADKLSNLVTRLETMPLPIKPDQETLRRLALRGVALSRKYEDELLSAAQFRLQALAANAPK